MIARRAPVASSLLLVVMALVAGCAANRPVPVSATPRFPTYPALDVPADLSLTAALLERHQNGWLRLQGGDLRGASRDFAEVIKRAPRFYPAETGLGFVALAGKDFKSATTHFTAALAVSSRYLPAWLGQADALLALNRDPDAIVAMTRILELDPSREAVRSRLDLLRFRALQTLVESGRKAHADRKLDEAGRLLRQALDLSPSSTSILRELVSVESDARRWTEAETLARQAVQLEPSDAEWHAMLGAVLEAAEKYREASAEFTRAATLAPRAEWRTKAVDLRVKADIAALPAEFSQIATADRVTRADVAAYLGIKLNGAITRAPKRITDIATDVRTHWAAPWIVPITQAGVMSIYPNHTFQPAAVVRRGDLATIVTAVLRLGATGRQADLTRRQAARPKFADLPATNTQYRAAAFAVTAGLMQTDPGDTFAVTRPASGQDLAAAVARLESLVAP